MKGYTNIFYNLIQNLGLVLYLSQISFELHTYTLIVSHMGLMTSSIVLLHGILLKCLYYCNSRTQSVETMVGDQIELMPRFFINVCSRIPKKPFF